ncbi:MAG TPA: M56 family metallopeptidase [Lysobacter sp.]
MLDPSTLVPMLGRALLHFVWQGALIGLVAALVLQLLHGARPQVRYAIACAALLACVLVPAIHLAMMIAAVGPGVPLAVDGVSLQIGAGTIAVVSTLSAWPARLDAAMPWIVVIWSAGACTLSLRMAVGLVWIQQLRTAPQGPAHAAWQARLDALATRFGIRAHVALRLVDSLDSPASAGWLRPVVLMPSALLARMPVDLLEALLAHELAHIRRHDYLVNLLQGVVEALLFYHPVTWWLSRRIRIEREHIADQLAAGVTGEPRRLALALSELSDFNRAALTRARSAQPHLVQAAHGGNLMSRIEQLVRPGRRAASGRVAFPLIGLAAACVAFYAHAQIDKTAPPAKAAVAQPAAAAQHAEAQHPAAKSTGTRVTDSNFISLKSGGSRDAYALISKDRDGITMSGSTDDLPQIQAARHSLQGDFVWFRRGGKSYVIVDAATVAKARDAWSDSARIGKQMEALGDQMEVHGDKMSALGDQMEALSARSGPSPAMEAASRRMEELGKEQAALGAKQAQLAADMMGSSVAEKDRLSSKMDALSQQQDALGQLMDDQSELLDAESRRLDARTAPMEALSRQMDEAGKPMDALGKQMDVLGAQHEKVVAKAEAETRKLINDAIGKGLALPAPTYAAQ